MYFPSEPPQWWVSHTRSTWWVSHTRSTWWVSHTRSTWWVSHTRSTWWVLYQHFSISEQVLSPMYGHVINHSMLYCKNGFMNFLLLNFAFFHVWSINNEQIGGWGIYFRTVHQRSIVHNSASIYQSTRASTLSSLPSI